MSFFVYFLVLLVAAGSVLFGFDWLQSPIPASPPSSQAVPVARAPAKSTTAPKPASEPNAKQLDAKLSPVYPARPSVPQSAVAEATTGAMVETRPLRKCDVDACARAYYSFRPFDCTYQPNNGPRRLCTKGNPPKSAAETAATEARAQASCNIEACRRAYISFNASDCTYQPYGGPRRLCTK